jgi:two-component system, sensor histidine kinase PdtaS
MALILNELVSNSLKHAFPNGRDGEVRVTLTRESPAGFRLVVEDDGAGTRLEVAFKEAA